jgi:hypothetical protein
VGAEKEPKYITHLGLDTSGLIAGGWPTLVSELDSALGTCNALNVPVLIPEVVLIETEAERLRQSAKALTAGRSALAEARHKTFGLVTHEIPPLNGEKIQAAYVQAVKQLGQRRPFEIVGLPADVSLSDALKASALHALPFVPEDKSFRDSMILWSMVAALKRGDVLGILSSDKFFEDARVADFAFDHGIQLRRFKTAREILDFIEQMARVTEFVNAFKEAESEAQRLRDLLRQDQDGVQNYVRQNLRVPEYPPGLDGHVTKVHDLKVTDIGYVHVSPLLKKPADPFADVAVRVEATVVPSLSLNLQRMLSVGEGTEQEELFKDLSSGLEPRVVEFDGNATVTFRVHEPRDPRCRPSFEFLAIRFETPLERAIKRKALIEALGAESKEE